MRFRGTFVSAVVLLAVSTSVSACGDDGSDGPEELPGAVLTVKPNPASPGDTLTLDLDTSGSQAARDPVRATYSGLERSDGHGGWTRINDLATLG